MLWQITPPVMPPKRPENAELLQLIGTPENEEPPDEDSSYEDQQQVEQAHDELEVALAERVASDSGAHVVPDPDLPCEVAADAGRVMVEVMDVASPSQASSSDASSSKPRIVSGNPQPLFVGASRSGTRVYTSVATVLLPLLKLHGAIPRLFRYHGDPSGSPVGMSKFINVFVGGEEWRRLADGETEHDWVAGDGLLVTGSAEPLAMVQVDDADGTVKPVLFYGPDFTAALPNRPFRLMLLAHAPDADAFLDAALPLPEDHPPYTLRKVLTEARGKHTHYSSAFQYALMGI